MKNIIDYIKKEYFDELYLEAMKDFFGDDLPNYVLESAKNNEYTDYILETLKSHNVNLLIKKIKEKFSKDHVITIIEIINNVEVKPASFGIDSDIDLSDENEFNNLLEFFGYYITQVRTLDNGLYYHIISPKYTDDANDMVYKDNNGKLYHFSTGKNAGEIERTGLRCRSAKYRYYPERIYCYASDKSFDKLDDLYNKVMTVINPFDAKMYGVYVYHIDLNKLTKDNYINFYSDDLMRDKSAVYTYNTIPANCIKLIKKLEYPIKNK